MTKKQLEKYQKEFDEFVANVEKMGGRFLTEDELRYKINGGEGGGDDGDAGEEQSDDSPAEGGGTDDFASDQTEATSGGAGETQAGNENEDSSGKSEETAEEDDDKSFWESVCEAVGGVVDAVGDAVSGAAHAVGEFVEDVIDFFTGGSKDDDKTVEESDSSDGKTETDKATSENKTSEGENKENSTKTEGAAASSDAASTANKNDSDLSTPERSDASKSDAGGSWWSSFCDRVAGVVSAVVGFFEDVYNDFTASGGKIDDGIAMPIAKDFSATIITPNSSPTKVSNYNSSPTTFNEEELKQKLIEDASKPYYDPGIFFGVRWHIGN